MSPASRAAVRRRYRAARRALSRSEQEQHAEAVARRFVATRVMLTFTRFAVYAPSDGELDPSPIADRLLAMNKIVALPVVERARQLNFYRYDLDARIVRNRFDIPEPDTGSATLVPTAILDVVLVPLVAFDDEGRRLGRGGGYYDATFGARRRALLIGLAHELQHHHGLIHQKWDVPLDAVITECAARGFTIRGRRFMSGAGTH
jgi:5-formyltetrahydrofolate cyclo-ligase